jgi:hypothetical protein
MNTFRDQSTINQNPYITNFLARYPSSFYTSTSDLGSSQHSPINLKIASNSPNSFDTFDQESPNLLRVTGLWHLWDYVLKYTKDGDSVLIKSIADSQIVNADVNQRQQIIDNIVGKGIIDVRKTAIESLFSNEPIFRYLWVDFKTDGLIIYTDYIERAMWNGVHYLFGQHLSAAPYSGY